jgi:hypothetical protein
VPDPSRRLIWIAVAAGVLLAVAVSVGIARGTWVVGSVAGGWTYPYVGEVAPRHLLLFSVVALGALALLGAPVGVRGGIPLLAGWILFATASHALVRTTAPFTLEALWISPGANSFYTFARQRAPSEILSRFTQVRRQAPLHAQSNMPGKTVLVHALLSVTGRTDVLPWLLVGLSNLGAVFMFGLARTIFEDDRTALFAAVLYLFTPGRVLFFPIMNAVTPVLVLGFAWLAASWLRSGRLSLALASGVALYLLAFFDPLPLVAGLFVGSIAAAAIARGSIGVERFMVHAGAMGLAFATTAALVYEATGFHLLRAFVGLAEHAVEFNQIASRPYRVWVGANLVEFVFAAGPAQTTLAAAALAWAVRTAAPRRDWWGHPLVAVSLGLFAVLLVTDVLGINRGEVVRLWIFLACLFQLPAARLSAALPGRSGLGAVLVVTWLQVCLATAVIAFSMP